MPIVPGWEPHSTYTTPTPHPLTPTPHPLTPTWHPHDSHTIPKWHPHNTQMTPTQHPNDTHTTSKWHPQISKMTPTGTQHPNDIAWHPHNTWHLNVTNTTPKWHPYITHTTPTCHPYNPHITLAQHPNDTRTTPNISVRSVSFPCFMLHHSSTQYVLEYKRMQNNELSDTISSDDDDAEQWTRLLSISCCNYKQFAFEQNIMCTSMQMN